MYHCEHQQIPEKMRQTLMVKMEKKLYTFNYFTACLTINDTHFYFSFFFIYLFSVVLFENIYIFFFFQSFFIRVSQERRLATYTLE